MTPKPVLMVYKEDMQEERERKLKSEESLLPSSFSFFMEIILQEQPVGHNT